MMAGMKFIDAILANKNARYAYGVVLLLMGAVAGYAGLTLNALVLGAIGLYFLVTGWE